MSVVLSDTDRLELLDPICRGLNAIKGSADEAQYLKETIAFVQERIELAKRSAHVVALPAPREARIKVLEVQIQVLWQELNALRAADAQAFC